MKGIDTKLNGRKKLIPVIVTGIILMVAIGLGVYFLIIKKGTQGNEERPQINVAGEDIISASGLTATGMVEETYELDFLETVLYVEESYLSIGDMVEEETPVFKVSDKTLEAARKELENKVTEAGLAYRQGEIDYETQKLEAESTYRQAEINQQYAQAVYDDSLQQTRQETESLEKQIEEAQEIYDEYVAVAENDYYYTYYNVEERKEEYYNNFSFLMELYEKWDIESLKDLYPNGVSSTSGTGNVSGTGNGSGTGNTSGTGNVSGTGNTSGTASSSGTGKGGSSEEAGKLTVYEMMETLVEKNGEEYETAVENYEKDTKMAIASLDLAKSNLATLQAELEEARLAYEKQVIASRTDYDTTIAESENAQNVYDTTVQKLEEELEALKDDKEEAEENLELFEDTIGDGYFYTGSSGTVMMNMVREDSYLTASDIIMAYSNPETVTVAAAVQQADIAKISVGDSAYIVIDEYGNYTGEVVSINPISTSESRSSVTYTVTVALAGEVENLESNLTAYVYFGMSEEEMEQRNQPTRADISKEDQAPAGETASEENRMPEGEAVSEEKQAPTGEENMRQEQAPAERESRFTGGKVQ